MSEIFKLNHRSIKNLEGVHPHLQELAHRAIQLSPVDFTITAGIRSIETQKELVAAGKSTTMNSRHLTGHAIDVAAFIAGNLSWEWQYYEAIADVFYQAASEIGIAVEWGGNWKSFKDGPHFQLPFRDYPV